ncbi:hypothetical protein A8990_12630 [Paenibacillus taihuensis]|uniref:Uncharacterized protein n=1 Tax=Paenibacillus taihuensis TaxID=1156355 RepID=A0A3D9RHW0_9BACL|nr:hypothetical protein [Paenibacillus taihuensis]REE78556.1 hypothetical protein A8990_12630 [Paenibacillus taihuensis]
MKKFVGIVVILIIIGVYSYNYVNNRVFDPFMIDASKETVESAASDLLNTQQNYNFRLVNTSDKPVKLLKIELLDYKGLKIDEMTISGKPFETQIIPSHRVYTSSDSWSTNSQGVDIDYNVEIIEKTIQNPNHVRLTYSYLGLKHHQIVKIPGLD